MRICQITSAAFPPEEGIGNYVYGLSTQLIKKGHHVTIITRGSRKTPELEHLGNIEILRAPFLPVYPFYMKLHKIFLNSLFKAHEQNFDIVHIHSPLTPPLQTSLPIIATIHTPMKTDTEASFNETKNLRTIIWKLSGTFISYPLEVALIKRADLITVVARSVANELQDYPIGQKDIIVMGNGIDSTMFTPIQHNSSEKYILFTGRLSYRKGLFDLIESAQYVCAHHPEISFYITGSGILSEKLKERISELGLTQHFKFLGFVTREELIRLYQHATLYVLPSHYEGLPTVLLEAMACGLPVVATAVSGNLDVITDQKNGLLIPPKAPQQLAEAITNVLDDENLRKTLGANARKTIEQHYTWDKISDHFLTQYQSLLKNTTYSP
jgi:glycosyltransferase involved in cell wall biosynthesis